MSSVSSSVGGDDVRADRACFDGMLLGCLAYGALMMLYVQLIQVLRVRPKRGRVFWGIVFYSIAVFPLATLAIIGRIRFAEITYITNRFYPSGAQAYSAAHSGLWPSVMSHTSSTLIPWIGDTLMLYRLLVFWSYQRWIIIFPGLLYLAHVSISVPLLISQIQPTSNTVHMKIYRTAFYSLCVSLNLVVSVLICVRIFMIRDKAEKVLGKLQASFYNSSVTLLVESGALFTIWSMMYLITLETDSWVQDVFLQPYSYILAITRMLIIMRMARDRAWSKDIIAAAVDGELEWQISSLHSLPPNLSEPPTSSQQSLPHKFMDDRLSSKSGH